MSGVIKVEILETVDELRELLKSTENQEVKERIQALSLFCYFRINFCKPFSRFLIIIRVCQLLVFWRSPKDRSK